MGSKGRLLFDLNEPPPQDDVNDNVDCFQPRKVIPSSSSVATSLLVTSTSSQGIVNNHAFFHASSVSGFQPFSRAKVGQGSDATEKGSLVDKLSDCALPSKPNGSHDLKAAAPKVQFGSVDAEDMEKEEGEWSDADGSVDACRNAVHVDSKDAPDEQVLHKGIGQIMESDELDGDLKNVNSNTRLEVNQVTNDKKDGTSVDGPDDSVPVPRQKEVKDIEGNHGSRSTSILGKRPKFDQKKEAMLGKKRNRQTMLINIEDVKQASALKTPRRQLPAPTITRTVKEIRSPMPPAEHGDKQFPPVIRDIKQADTSSNGNNNFMELNEDCENDGDNKFNGSADPSSEEPTAPIVRQGSSKLLPDTRQHKNVQFSGRKPAFTSQSSTDPKLTLKKLPSKKQTNFSNQYQDTSVERLLREVTNDKFWHHSAEDELQCVPGHFDSVEEYINVFEPLLFEECRAQVYSAWEESLETASSHVRVGIRNIERRERGWFDVILIPQHEHKWTFKEGDVAVLSSPKPGSANSMRDNTSVGEVIGRVAGTVRRYMPIDARDHSGAIFHFYVGDSSDSSSESGDDHILLKLRPGGVWFLTALGAVATTQREYVALHAFRRLDLQMQNAILQPSPEQFPKYEENTPSMPDCFTPNFVEHLHKSFNRPQLSAIQWAAMHTAAGTNNGLTKKQDLWPFTLVQGPPGTGKTHTVWGMLNVIHLVQYQHYYTALLKKLAPESYKQVNETASDNVVVGSIDEVLQSMDRNLLRTLPKLCPKPRMLVCAPSNAATDELLARVLDRGFIDGEMKVYRPDVARVGVDSQTRAAQAVSVERRTEQLLMKSRDEVLGWMHNLRLRETQLSQQISCLQRDLNLAAANGRAQGSVGVDPDILMARDQNRDSLLQQLAAVVENRDKTLVEMSRLLMLEGKFRPGSNFNLEEARANLEASFANEAEIVFTTVSSSGRKLFSRLTHGFDMVVIDEAAQASEVGILPPLSLGASRCVLVGDPQQLPATVISKAAGTLMYSRSLFERFQQAGCPTMLLSVQYRMHPQIRDFPSRYFYQGRLMDSESVASLPDEIYYKDPLLRPYIFFDIAYGRESHRGGSVSYQNTQEALFCVRLYEYLQKFIKSLGTEKVSVGIITPYKLQLKCLQREFKDVMNSDEGKDIYINTVDAFQGQERDVIIMSCVRASSRGVGFVSDIRRMNVALTRARRALWIMGNASALAQSDDWAALIEDAKTRKCYLTMDSLPKDFIAEPSNHGMFSTKFSGSRSLRSGRYRPQDLHVESRSGTPSEEDEKPSMPMFPKNGYRNLRSGTDNLLYDASKSRERSRDSWQHGTQKKQNTAGILGKKDL